MPGDRLSFGIFLRALRLRYCYVSRLNGFMRISEVDDGWLVELRPNKLETLNQGKGRLHRMIEDPEAIIALSPVLSKVSRIEAPADLVLNEVGELATDATG